MPGGPDIHRNPFPGLRPFQEAEEYLFFGRESQIDAMVDKLAATRFLAVIGTSGSGKSSLVNCGLRPALRGGLMAEAGTAWRMAQFRPGNNPIGAMAHALAEDGMLFTDYQGSGLSLTEIIETTLRMSTLGLVDICEQAQLEPGVNLLVVVDQFEELFRYRQLEDGRQADTHSIREAATAFVNLLLAAKQQTGQAIYIVLTMRSDYLGDCTHVPGLAEAINEGQYLVPRMTRDERRAAISGPVGVAGAEITPVLLTRLVNDVGDNPDQLSILQHALNRTWAHWEEEEGGKGPLDLAHYETIGTISDALNRHADKAFDELETARQRLICEKLFKALTDKATDPRGVRRPTTLATLCALADATEEEVASVIEVFREPSRSFLMPPAGDALVADTVIDISHESLMRLWQRLRAWANEEAHSAQTYRRLAETAALYSEGKASLWRDPDLQLALNWCAEDQPTAAWARRYGEGFDDAMRFLEESEVVEREAKRAAELQIKQKYRTMAVAALSVAIALSGGLYSMWDRNKRIEEVNRHIRETNRQISLTRDLSVIAKESTNGDPIKGLVVALGSLQRHLKEGDERAVPLLLESGIWRLYSLTHLKRILKNHKGDVRTVVFSSDGKLLATGAYDGDVYVYDTRDWSPRKIDEGGSDGPEAASRVRGLAFSPKSDALATASRIESSRRGRVRLWDPRTGKLLREFAADPDARTAHSRVVRNLKFDSSGEWLVTASYDTTARVWNVKTGALRATLQGHRKGAKIEDLQDAAFHPGNPDIVATVGDDGRAVIWNLSKAPLPVHPALGRDRIWQPDGKLAGSITVPWNTVFLEAHAENILDKHKQKITSVAFSPDGKELITASNDDTVRAWDWKSGKPIGKPLAAHSADIRRAVFNKAGDRIFTASWDQTAAVWDNATFYLLHRFRGHSRQIRDIAYSDAARRLATGAQDSTTRIWALDGDDVVAKLEIEKPINAARTNPADRNEFAVAGYDGIVRTWKLNDTVPVERARYASQTCAGSTSSMAACDLLDILYSQDGSRIAAHHRGGVVRIWDTTSGAMVGPALRFRGSLQIAVVQNNVLAVSAYSRGRSVLSFWRLKDGHKEESVGFEHADLSIEGRIRALAYSEKKKLLAAGLHDGRVLLWKLGTRGPPEVLSKKFYGRVISLRFDESGSTLFAGASRTIVTWNLEERKVQALMKGHDGWIWSLDIIDGGRRLASVSADESIKIWDVELSKEIITLPGHTRTIRGLAINPEKNYLISASEGGRIIIRRYFSDILQARDTVCASLKTKNLKLGEYFGPEETLDDICPAAKP